MQLDWLQNLLNTALGMLSLYVSYIFDIWFFKSKKNSTFRIMKNVLYFTLNILHVLEKLNFQI